MAKAPLTLSELRDIVTVETPISEDEITNPIYKRAIEKSLTIINMYRPRIMTGTKDFESMSQYVDLNITYLKKVELYKVDRAEVGLPVNVGTQHQSDLIVYSLDYTFESIYSAQSSLIDYFEQLVSFHTMIFAANKRRSAEMSELPFDLKGDAFYTEAVEKIEEIKVLLQNSIPQILE